MIATTDIPTITMLAITITVSSIRLMLVMPLKLKLLINLNVGDAGKGADEIDWGSLPRTQKTKTVSNSRLTTPVRIEQDAVLLANRIKLLQLEERRTQKIVEQTTKRAEEIERLRQRNEQKQREKALQRQLEEQAVALKAQTNYLRSRQQMANTVRIQQGIFEMK